MSIFGGTARKAQKAAALRDMKRDMDRAFTFGSLDPDETNFAQMFVRPFGLGAALLDAQPTTYDQEFSAAYRPRCPYCGVKRADDGKSCDGCGGHL